VREAGRAWAVVLGIIAVLGVFPVVTRRDSYPVSDFPMFSSRRTATESVDTAVAVGPDGLDARVWRLDPRLIAATDEVIIAAVTVSRAIQSGTADQLCADIAARVAARGPSGATTVEVVTERFDAVRWFEGDHTPITRRVHAECPVPRDDVAPVESP
jgi:hypothetical protein